MDYKGQKLLKNSTEALASLKRDQKSDYRRVYHLLDELGFGNLKSQFSEHQIMDSTLAYMESEEELKVLLKEVGLPAGPVFAFVKLWFRYKNNPDIFELDTNCFSHGVLNNHVEPLNLGSEDKSTQTGTVNTLEVGTQTHMLGLYQAQLPQPPDPYDMFRSYANLPYLPRMPLTGNLPAPGTNAYGLSPWHLNAISNMYQDPSSYSGTARTNEFSGLMNGFTEKNSIDPLENFSPHDTDESGVIPLEKNGSEVSIESEGILKTSNEYALFPNTEPLCSPKTSHMNIVNEKDDVMISRHLLTDQERENKSYATALKDHKEGQQPLSNSLHKDPLLSPSGARSRSSSTASNNLSRSASSSDFHPLSPTRETHEILTKSPPNRPYLCVDDIDPQQKANHSKTKCLSSSSNPSFSDYYDNLPETAEYQEAIKEKNVKAGWRPITGKHEKSNRRMEFKPQYIDKEGRVRHGVRVRGALKSMECWLHTNSKPPIDCLFAHSRIGDTLEFICVRCTYEKPRNYECRDKKGHAAFVCNLGPYRDITGEKWKGKVET